MIKAGYQVNITTWENDGDNYKVETRSGLTPSQVRMYIELCKFFESGTNNKGVGPDGRGNYGNADVQYEEEARHGSLKEGYSRNCFNPWEFYKEFLKFCENRGIDTELFSEDSYYIDIGSWNDGNYVRVFESIEVLYLPEDIQSITLSEFEEE